MSDVHIVTLEGGGVTCAESCTSSTSTASSDLLSVSDTRSEATKDERLLDAFLRSSSRILSHCGDHGGQRLQRTTRSRSLVKNGYREYVFKHFEETHKDILRYRFYHTVGGVGRFGLDPRALNIDISGESHHTSDGKTESIRPREEGALDPTYFGGSSRCLTSHSLSALHRKKASSCSIEPCQEKTSPCSIKPCRPRTSPCSIKPSRRVYLTWNQYVDMCGPDGAHSAPRSLTSGCNFRLATNAGQETRYCSQPSQQLPSSNILVPVNCTSNKFVLHRDQLMGTML